MPRWRLPRLVIPLLVTGIHRAASSGACGYLDAGDKPRHDNGVGELALVEVAPPPELEHLQVPDPIGAICAPDVVRGEELADCLRAEEAMARQSLRRQRGQHVVLQAADEPVVDRHDE